MVPGVKWKVALTAFAVASTATMGHGDPPPIVPDVIPVSTAVGAPAHWASAAAAVDEKGNLRWDLLGESAREMTNHIVLRQWLRLHPRSLLTASGEVDYDAMRRGLPCVDWGAQLGPLTDNGMDRTLLDVMHDADGAVHGRVVAEAQGFYHGHAETLLAIDVLDPEFSAALPSVNPIRTTPYLYIPFPAADFRVGDLVFCTRPAAFPHCPDVSDEVIALVNPPAEGPGRNLVPALRVFFERPDGTLVIPEVSRRVPELRGARSLAEVRSLLLAAARVRDEWVRAHPLPSPITRIER